MGRRSRTDTEGVTTTQRPDGRWRIRWRERLEGGGSRQRERVVATSSAADAIASKVRRALRHGEIPEVHATVPAPPAAPPTVTWDQILAAYLQALPSDLAASTLASYGASLGRCLDALRVGGAAVPLGALDDAVYARLGRDRRGLSAGTVRNDLRVLLEAWRYALGDPARFPGVPPAPLRAPRPPVYVAAPAPTWAETDAMLRELAAMRRPTVALPLAEILRATGLRSGQGLALVVGDLVRGPDGSPGLHVPAGKSRREQEEDRVVPIAPVLAPLLAALAAEAEAEGRTHLVPFHGSVAGGRRTSVARTFRGAWEAATARGEARRDVWDPPKRGQARPVHALRAGLQAELLRAGVAEAVVKALVGHAGGLAGGHYVSVEDRWAAMRAAVATIPPIWWG